MKFGITVLALASWGGVAIGTAALAAGNPAAGQRAATVCLACHGPGGVSVNALWPNLAGQKNDYILKQLHGFKDDTRKDSLMTPIAKNLSDTEMEDLAAYFSGLATCTK